jgi:hypothetical protein
MTADSYRVFLGFRLTPSDKSLHNHSKTIKNQGVPASLPGGMPIKMYEKLQMRFHLRQLIEWSQVFKKECLETKTNKKTQKQYQIVHQEMHSLKDYGFTLYPVYTEEEKRIMTPQKMM